MWSPVQEGTRARQSAPHLLPHPLLRVMWKDIPVACEHCDAKGKSVRTETKRKGHVFLVSYPFCPRQKPHVFPRTVVCKPPPPKLGSVSALYPGWSRFLYCVPHSVSCFLIPFALRQQGPAPLSTDCTFTRLGSLDKANLTPTCNQGRNTRNRRNSSEFYALGLAISHRC